MKRLERCLFVGMLLFGFIGCALAEDAASPSDKELRTRQFIVMGYHGILTELSGSKGPYLATLADLLQIEPSKQAEIEKEWKRLSQARPNIMDFADHVLMTANALLPTPMAPQNVLPTDRKLYIGDDLENALQHLGRGMQVIVYLRAGGKIEGHVSEYSSKRLWIRTPAMKSCNRADIQAIEAPAL